MSQESDTIRDDERITRQIAEVFAEAQKAWCCEKAPDLDSYSWFGRSDWHGASIELEHLSGAFSSLQDNVWSKTGQHWILWHRIGEVLRAFERLEEELRGCSNAIGRGLCELAGALACLVATAQEVRGMARREFQSRMSPIFDRALSSVDLLQQEFTKGKRQELELTDWCARCFTPDYDDSEVSYWFYRVSSY